MSKKVATKTTKTSKPATVASVKKTLNGNLELTRAIQKIIKNQDDFMTSVTNLTSYTDETFNDLNLQIESKKVEIENLGSEYDNRRRQYDIETSHYYSEHKYEGAISYLGEKGEEAVKSSELARMVAEIEKLKQSREDELNNAVTKEKVESKRAISSITQHLELKHKADIAELNASVKQQKNEILSMAKTIDSYKEDITAQRELTKDVALASKQGAINQTIGK
jgi:hypothetical protein